MSNTDEKEYPMIRIDSLEYRIRKLRTPTYEETAYGDVVNRADVLALLGKKLAYDSMDPFCGCGGEGHDGPCYGPKRAGYE